LSDGAARRKPAQKPVFGIFEGGGAKGVSHIGGLAAAERARLAIRQFPVLALHPCDPPGASLEGRVSMEKQGFIRDTPEIEEARARAYGREPAAATPNDAGLEPRGVEDERKRAMEARRQALLEKRRKLTPQL
jgi:hypothetical protein